MSNRVVIAASALIILTGAAAGMDSCGSSEDDAETRATPASITTVPALVDSDTLQRGQTEGTARQPKRSVVVRLRRTRAAKRLAAVAVSATTTAKGNILLDVTVLTKYRRLSVVLCCKPGQTRRTEPLLLARRGVGTLKTNISSETLSGYRYIDALALVPTRGRRGKTAVVARVSVNRLRRKLLRRH